MVDLKDKVAVITGAASGIGRAIALALCRRGAVVHLLDIDAAGLDAALQELEAIRPGHMSHCVDIRDAEAVNAVADRVFAASGRTDILVSNAGVCDGGPFEELGMDDWRWSLDVNFWGVVHALRAFVPRMGASGPGGVVVQTASMAGLVAFPFMAPYCASKFAVVGLCEALEPELACRGIQVITVCPGAVRTRVFSNSRIRLPGAWRERIERIFEKRAIEPDLLAARVVRAIMKRKRLVVVGSGMGVLWIIKRLSVRLYLWIAETVTRAAMQQS